MQITAIKQQVKRADRYSVYVDGKYAFSLGEAALLDARVASGQSIDDGQLAAYKKLSSDDKAYNNALRYAAMRPHSEWEMQTYLRRKQVEEPVIEQVMQRLRGIGMLDDALFAKSWVDNRRQLKPTSTRKLRLELKQKHIADDMIDAALREDDGDYDALMQLVRKKVAISRYQAEPQKLMAYLARQGFGFDDIKRAMAEVQAE